MDYDKLVNFGLLGFFISGIIIVGLIISGNAHFSIPINTLVGRWSVLQPNPVFDYSVLANFCSLLLVGLGKLGGGE